MSFVLLGNNFIIYHLVIFQIMYWYLLEQQVQGFQRTVMYSRDFHLLILLSYL